MLNSSGSVGIKEHETKASMAVRLGDDGGPELEWFSDEDDLSEPYGIGKAAKSYGIPVSGDGRPAVFGDAGGERPKSLNADLCRLSAASAANDDVGVCPV